MPGVPVLEETWQALRVANSFNIWYSFIRIDGVYWRWMADANLWFHWDQPSSAWVSATPPFKELTPLP